MKSKQSDRKSVVFFWIAAFLVVGLAALFSLILSEKNIPQPPKGQEAAAVHMVTSLLTEGNIHLSGEEAAALLFPVLKNAMGEKLTGFNLQTENNKAEFLLGTKISGQALGVRAQAEILKTEEAFGLCFSEVYVGRLPVPPSWAVERAGENLKSIERIEGNTLWIPRRLTVPLIEGREPVSLYVQELFLNKEGVLVEISLKDELLSSLKEDWPF